MPKPAPNQAWVELAPHDETELVAVAVDQKKPLDDDRYK
jgi:hypothetical protein